MAIQIPLRKFTVAQFELMGRTGVLQEDDRVELIEGNIVEMAPIGSRHAACVERLSAFFHARLEPETSMVRVQQPVILDAGNEPQPDVVIARHRRDFYEMRHPGPDEILLLVEVAETTLAFDRGEKLSVYARSGVPEVWIVDLTENRILIFRQPSQDGYGWQHEMKPGQAIGLSQLPLVVDAAKFFDAQESA
jgi:Uma2 family endonuclease